MYEFQKINIQLKTVNKTEILQDCNTICIFYLFLQLKWHFIDPSPNIYWQIDVYFIKSF